MNYQIISRDRLNCVTSYYKLSCNFVQHDTLVKAQVMDFFYVLFHEATTSSYSQGPSFISKLNKIHCVVCINFHDGGDLNQVEVLLVVIVFKLLTEHSVVKLNIEE